MKAKLLTQNKYWSAPQAACLTLYYMTVFHVRKQRPTIKGTPIE